MTGTMIRLIFTLTLLTAYSVDASAQECVGIPHAGPVALTNLKTDGRHHTIEPAVILSGMSRWSVGAGASIPFTYPHSSPPASGFGKVAYELRVPASLCPMAELQYLSYRNTSTLQTTAGASIGRTFSIFTDAIAVAHIGGGLVYRSVTAAEFSVSDTQVFAQPGISISNRPAIMQASVKIETGEGTRPAYSFGFGFIF
jgi:hypothetical protein